MRHGSSGSRMSVGSLDDDRRRSADYRDGVQYPYAEGSIARKRRLPRCLSRIEPLAEQPPGYGLVQNDAGIGCWWPTDA